LHERTSWERGGRYTRRGISLIKLGKKECGDSYKNRGSRGKKKKTMTEMKGPQNSSRKSGGEGVKPQGVWCKNDDQPMTKKVKFLAGQ